MRGAGDRVARAAGLLALHGAGAVAGAGLHALDAPLPWVIGPLVATSAFTLHGGFRAPPVALRWAGQWIVASAVALNLSPDAVRVIAGDLPVMLAVAAMGIAIAALLARGLDRAGVLDARTGLLSLLPGGAAEMAALAGPRADFVVVAQTLRLSLTIVVVPSLLVLLDTGAAGGVAPLAAAASPAHGVAALGLALPAALALHRVGVANAFFLAPLGVVGVLALSGWTVGGLPAWLVGAGQVMLGVSLGAMVRPRMLARRLADLRLALVLAATLVALGIGFALGLTALGVGAFGQMLLATSAGGVAEMAVAAKWMGFDPAHVAAFHLVRIFVIVALAGRLLDLLAR